MEAADADTRILLDPTPSTEARILSQVTAVEKVFDQKVLSVLVEIESMKQAHKLFHEDLTRVPTSVDKAVGGLKELIEQKYEERHHTINEKFTSIHSLLEGIQLQFRERDTRTEQIKLGNDAALKAALDAAKEGVVQQNLAFTREMIKSENLFTKQLDQLVILFQNGMKSTDEKIFTATKTSDDKIVSMEKQLTLLIGTGVGQLSTQQIQRDSSGHMWQVVGVLCAALIGVGALVISIMRMS